MTQDIGSASKIERHQSSSYRTILLLAAILALATGLRLTHLGAKGLWADEIFTATFSAAENTVAEVIRQSLSTPIPAPPLWPLATHLFQVLLGSSEFVVRLPAAIAGVLGVWATYRVGRTMFDGTTGLIGALLLAVSPLHLYFSQEARYYAAVILFSLLSLHFLCQGTTGKQKTAWVGFTIVTLLNLYTHLSAFFVLASEVVYAGILLAYAVVTARRAGRLDRRNLWGLKETFALPMLVSLATIGLAYLPMAPYILRGLEGPRGLGSSAVEGLDLSSGGLISLFGGLSPGIGVELSLYLAACLWGLVNSARKRGREVILLVVWMTVPFAMVFVLRPLHWFNVKYVISILPIYLLAVSLGLIHLTRSFTRALGSGAHSRWRSLLPVTSLTVLAVVYSLLSIPALGEVYDWQAGHWREIGQILEENLQPDDAVVIAPLVFMTMDAQDVIAYYGPPADAAHIVEVSSSEDLEAVLVDHRRVWIVVDRHARADGLAELGSWLDPQPLVKLGVGNRTEIWYTGFAQTSASLSSEASEFTLPSATSVNSLPLDD